MALRVGWEPEGRGAAAAGAAAPPSVGPAARGGRVRGLIVALQAQRLPSGLPPEPHAAAAPELGRGGGSAAPDSGVRSGATPRAQLSAASKAGSGSEVRRMAAMALCGDGTLPATEAQPEHGAAPASRAATAPRGGTPRQRRGSSEAAGAAEAAGESLDLKLRPGSRSGTPGSGSDVRRLAAMALATAPSSARETTSSTRATPAGEARSAAPLAHGSSWRQLTSGGLGDSSAAEPRDGGGSSSRVHSGRRAGPHHRQDVMTQLEEARWHTS